MPRPPGEVPPGRPSLRHRIEHFLFRAFAGAVGLLPEGPALRLGEWAGWAAGTVLRVRRREVDRHLGWAFPEWRDEERRRVARACYRHLGREGVAMLRLADLDQEEVRERTVVRGLEALRRALEADRGAVIVTGHLGNWEVGGAALACRGVPLDVVALRQGNPLFDRSLVETRERLGMRVIYKAEATGEALRSLRRGRAVALVGDQNPISGGIEVPFFGRAANTPRGPAVLALRTGAPLYLAVVTRQCRQHVSHVLSLEPVRAERSGDTGRDVRRLVEAYTRMLEGAVRASPGQYFWHHRRWKERNRPV